jgi:hypothetical protein
MRRAIVDAEEMSKPKKPIAEIKPTVYHQGLQATGDLPL